MSLPKWASFIQQCLVQRVYGDEFQDMASCMIERHHVTGQAVLDIVIRCRGSFCLAEDTLILLYVRALVTLIEATGSLIAALASSDNGMAVLADKYRSGELRGLLSIFATDGEFSEPRESVKRALDASQPYMATVSMQLHERLDAVQKHF